MGDLTKELFGGSKTSSKPKDVTPPELAALRGPFAEALTSFLQQQPTYTGPLVAPLAAGEAAALPQVAAAATDPNRSALLADTLTGKFLPGQPGGNPYLEEAIRIAQRPTEQALTDTLTRALPGAFTAAGQQIGGGLRSPNANLQPGSTAFDLAAARAFEAGSRTLGDIATNISNAQYQQERGLQQAAIGLGQQEVQTLTTNLQAQALPRLIEDLGVQRGLELFQKNIAALLQALAIAGGSPISQVAAESKGESFGGAIPALKDTLLLPKGVPASIGG